MRILYIPLIVKSAFAVTTVAPTGPLPSNLTVNSSLSFNKAADKSRPPIKVLPSTADDALHVSCLFALHQQDLWH